MRAAEVSSDLSYRAGLPVGKEVERSDLRQRELGRCQLLRRGKDELAPEAADGDDATADLTEALSASRDLVERALPHLTTGDANGCGEATAQPLGGLRDLSNSVTARCMHMRIH